MCFIVILSSLYNNIGGVSKKTGNLNQPLKIPTANHHTVTRFKITDGFLNAATSILKGLLEGFSQLVSVFIEAS
jgi:hypothetical protein